MQQVNPERRLGSGKTGAEEIKKHKWFGRLDWAALQQKRLPAPIKPKVTRPLDTSNFDTFEGGESIPLGSRGDKNAGAWDLWEWIE